MIIAVVKRVCASLLVVFAIAAHAQPPEKIDLDDITMTVVGEEALPDPGREDAKVMDSWDAGR